MSKPEKLIEVAMPVKEISAESGKTCETLLKKYDNLTKLIKKAEA